jgi:hypothetical protein
LTKVLDSESLSEEVLEIIKQAKKKVNPKHSVFITVSEEDGSFTLTEVEKEEKKEVEHEVSLDTLSVRKLSIQQLNV